MMGAGIVTSDQAQAVAACVFSWLLAKMKIAIDRIFSNLATMTLLRLNEKSGGY